MSSINNNKPVPSRSPSLQSIRTATPSEGSAVSASPTQGVDVIESGRSNVESLQQLPPRALSATTRANSVTSTSSVSITNEAPRTKEQQDAIDEASKKGLSALVREVSVKTSGARSATKYTTVAGIGLAFGLLFAGQPIGVMFIIPAFAVLGAIIAYVMRAAHNAKVDPSIEAFKDKMKNLSEEDKLNPDLAEALQLNAFLTDSFATFAKTQVKGLVSGFKNPLAGLSAKFAEAKAALEQQAAEANQEAPISAAPSQSSARQAPADSDDNISRKEIDSSDSASNVGGAQARGVQNGDENIEDAASDLSDDDWKTAQAFSQRTTDA